MNKISGNKPNFCIISNKALVSWGDDSFNQVSNTPSDSNYKHISVGYFHCCAVKLDGSLASWGRDNYNQVSNTPTSNDFSLVECGDGFTIALKTDGSIIGWGRNDFNQISNIPIGNDYINITTERSVIIALKSDGSLIAWGFNQDNLISSLPSGNNFVEVKCAYRHALALKSDGSLVSWGNDHGVFLQITNTPIGNDFIKVECGYDMSIALKIDGSIIAWGKNTNNQITNIPVGNNYIDFSCGYDCILLLKEDNTITVVGSNNYNLISDAPTLLFSAINKYLFKNNITGEYLAPTGISSWMNLGTGPITEQNFLDRGVEDFNVFDNTILNSINSGFLGDNPGILNYIDDPNVISRDLTIDYIPEPQLILANGDIDISSISDIDNINLVSSEVEFGILRIIASIDSGVTWYTFNGTNWITVDVEDFNDVKTNGMTTSTLNTLTSQEIMELIGVPGTLRFGYYMEIGTLLDSISTDSISITIDMQGEWEKAIHKVDYNYDYPNNTKLSVELYTSGDFKINY